MNFYIRLDADNVIRDCITYPYDGYIEVDIPTPLPDGFLGGWYIWQNGEPVYDRTLFEQVNEVPELQAKISRANDWAAELETYAFEQAYQLALLTITGGGE